MFINWNYRKSNNLARIWIEDFLWFKIISEQKRYVVIKQGTTSTQRNDLIRTIILITVSYIWNTIVAYHLPVWMYVVYTYILYKTCETFSEYNIRLPSSSLDAHGLHPYTLQNWQSPRWAKGRPTKMATQGYRTTEIIDGFQI